MWLVLATLGTALRAHDPGLSSLDVTVTPNGLVAVLGLAVADFERAGGPALDRAAIEAGHATALEPWLRSMVQLRGDGAVLDLESVVLELADSESVEIRFQCARPAAAAVHCELVGLRRLPHGHRCFVSALRADGAVVAEGLLHTNRPALAIPMIGAGSASGWQLGAQFVELGVEHIFIGIDHVLFLLSLLLTVRTWRGAAGVVTAFTLAHSITLGLAAMQVVTLPGWLVEPVIAVSIVYVALSNVWSRGGGHRWAVTFGFGLIHGFGFASVLADLSAGGSGGALVPLLGFNLGVEIGQLAIAVVALPLLGWILAGNRRRRLVPVLSIGIAAVGAWWVVERTLLA